MKRRFWAHQFDAFKYARRTRHPALFMEMRLGKNLVTIRRVNLYKPLTPRAGLQVLIVCPSSAFAGWKHDLTLEGEDSVVMLMGTRGQRLAILQESLGKWNIINKEGHLSLPEIADVDWDVVILDESTFIKNPRAKVTRFFLQNFRDVPHRWILTGTPNPESDLEFWSQLAFLDGSFLRCRNYWDFRARYCKPDVFSFGWVPKSETTPLIQKAIGSRCMITRRKDVGMDSVKIRETRKVEFPDRIRETYDRIENEYAISDDVQTKWAMTRYTWLRQLCGGILDGTLVWSGKIELLIELLRGELKREPVVVWFLYNQELFAVEKALRKAGISCAMLYGAVSLKRREFRRQRFQSGKVRVLLLQQAVATFSMDLSHADTAIYYSEPPGQLASKQTHDRIVHLSKGRGPLLIVYLQVKNSVDEDVHTILSGKKMRSGVQMSRALRHSMTARRERA